MSLMDNLLKLYRVDSQVRGLRSRLGSASRYLEVQTRQLSEVTERLEELQTRKRHVQAKIANLETEAAGLDEQLEKFRGDLNASVTNKQYTAVLAELNTVKEARGRIDDSILEEMEQIEQIDAQLAEVAEQQAERAKVRDVADAQLRQRQEDVGERLAELETEREEAAAEVPGNVLAVFQEIADAHEGEALAPVEEIDRRHREYACGECNMHMPFEQVALLMGTGGEIVRCTACGRILYMQEEVRGALAPK
jgi:predicted  nucleic acid-binding Zn-ribbon protein